MSITLPITALVSIIFKNVVSEVYKEVGPQTVYISSKQKQSSINISQI